MDFMLLSLEKYLLGRNIHNFSDDCTAIDKSDILNTCKYLLLKNNINKIMFTLIRKIMCYVIN